MYRLQALPVADTGKCLFFLLTYLKTSALQVVQGRLFGMLQGKVHQWIHVLLPVLLAALRTLGDVPTRSLTALAQLPAGSRLWQDLAQTQHSCHQPQTRQACEASR
jgi:hypothetical protein